MGMGFAPTWLRQVSPSAKHDHFNHCSALYTDKSRNGDFSPTYSKN